MKTSNSVNSKEITIFLNSANLLDKLKSLDTAKNSNNIPADDDDLLNDDEFESFLNNNNNVAKSPVKRTKKEEISSTSTTAVNDKVKKTRRRSSSTQSTVTSGSVASDLPSEFNIKDLVDTEKKTTKGGSKANKAPAKRKKKYVSTKDVDYVPPWEVPEKVTRNTRQSRRLSSSNPAENVQPTTLVASEEAIEDVLNMAHTRTTLQAFEAIRKIAEQNAKAAAAAEKKNPPEIVPLNANSIGDSGKGGRGRAKRSVNNNAQTAEPNIVNNHIPNSVVTLPENTATTPLEMGSHQPSSSASIMQRFLQQSSSRGRRGRAQNSRARRDHVAEIAARSNQVDFIDLISSPLPRVEGTIALDSDGEEVVPLFNGKSNVTEMSKNPSLDISMEDDNPELSVKINWKGKPEAFKLRKYQKFAVIFKQLAEREGNDMENMVFNINERIVTAEDTPDSIDYKIFQFISKYTFVAMFIRGCEQAEEL